MIFLSSSCTHHLVKKMYAQYQINLENPQEIEGITWKPLKGKSVSQVFGIEQINAFSEKNAELLKSNSISLILIGYEEGGAWTNTGSCKIICGPNGEMLRGIRLSHSCNATHGMFIGNNLIEINVSFWNKRNLNYRISIEQFCIENFFVVKTKELLCLETNDNLKETLPTKFQRFHDAIEAGMSKSTMYHCRELVFGW